MADGLVRSAHDCSEGGLLVAAAEMSFAGRLGMEVNLEGVPRRGRDGDALGFAFAETPSRILIEVKPSDFDAVARRLRESHVPFGHVATLNDTDRFIVREGGRVLARLTIGQMLEAWRSPLDW
jgi:phosphoribosylformylglycinamidine synthase